MSTPKKPQQEHASTYFVQNRSDKKDLARLQILDQSMTTGMGGVLSEQSNPALFHSVLDVACGTGGWLIEAAKTYPTMTKLIGVDISNTLLNYARSQTKESQVDDRVEFHQMDALRKLEFPQGYFDLTNQRLAASYARTWDWPTLLSEFQRVTRPGGTIRLTEANFASETNSPSANRLFGMMIDAFYRAGHLFTQESSGVSAEIDQLLERYGLQNVQKRAYALDSRFGTPEGQHAYDEMLALTFRTVAPFLKKWIRITDDYDALYQQALKEMQQPDFYYIIRITTAWGNTPLKRYRGL